jgi:hypothetical protein
MLAAADCKAHAPVAQNIHNNSNVLLLQCYKPIGFALLSAQAYCCWSRPNGSRRLLCVQLGWLHSWSAYHTYLKEQPDKPDPLVQFRQDLLKACGEQVGHSSM